MVGYGYEDIMYALDVKKKDILIFHIDNHVIHDGLDVKTVFRKEKKNPISNIDKLYINEKIKK